ncbi:sucrase-isomaltase, intestinal-like [Physella acuta]|uniref:sucrase-isomaltase, intestinal-like n=1 Tax=Physella acuta TaxID=109671 RepID=UPI0027DB11CD|nr:sucrase-isomaltase, intestinal-like [Physella acuta]
MIASGEEAGIFIKTSENTTLIGEVWPGVTAYPDFTNEKSQQWWTRWIRYYREVIEVDVHALWIDMNEPSNFIKGSTTGCNRNNLNYPPYVPHLDGVEENGELFVKTLCMDARQDWGLHYDVHSLYAHSMAMRTHTTLREIFPGKRPWTMTRASFVGTGHYATKWQGDNQARWDNMHFSIISLMEFGLFGFPMNGADICGFWLEPSYEMCVRWHQLGAFYPFARDHNGKGDDPVVFQHQDPVSFGSKFVDLVKPVLETRYKFLPYLYTQLYRAHDEGELVFKPLLFEFPADSKTLSIDRQFMLGPAFLLSPVLEPNVTSVEAYFPAGRWFDYVTGEEIKSKGESKTLATPLDKYNLHIRGGFVVPWQVPDVTTEASRRNDLGLLVALDEGQLAQGQLYWDDGVSDINIESPNYNLIKFEMKKPGQLDITPDVQSVTDVTGTLAFTSLEIYGLEQAPVKIWVNNSLQVNVNVTFNNKVARLTLMDGLPMTSPSVIRWDV